MQQSSMGPFVQRAFFFCLFLCIASLVVARKKEGGAVSGKVTQKDIVKRMYALEERVRHLQQRLERAESALLQLDGNS